MPHRRQLQVPFALGCTLIALAGLLAGCRSIEPTRVASLAAFAALFTGTSTKVTVEAPPPADATAITATVEATPMITPTGEASAIPVETAAGAPAGQVVPVTLTIPAINLDVPVVPMGWEIVLIDNQPATRWVIPEDAAGWAVNSAGAGEQGNVIIAGHQALGAAVFRPLALGEVETGQEIQLTGSNGKVYLYRVTEESAPIAAIGATANDLARAAAYVEPSAIGKLTLISGWPADTSTHRVFIVAELAGVQP